MVLVALILALATTLVTLTILISHQPRNGKPQSDNSAGRSFSLDSEAKKRVLTAYGKLPLSFEVNEGQTDRKAKFISRGDGYTLFLTSDGAALRLRGESKATNRGSRHTAVKMNFRNANPTPHATAVGELPGKSNYFIGNDPTKWRTNVSRYAKVKYNEVYPGIDLVYYGNQEQLEYDFVVAPGADPSVIRLAYAGAEKVEVDQNGDLVLKTSIGELRQHKPILYQEVEGARREIAGNFVIKGENEVGFEIGDYDASHPLVIDPTLSWATLLGGSGDEIARAVASDFEGNAYVTGATDSVDFPISSGAVDKTIVLEDAFITKFNPAGTAIIYSTFIGGSIGLPAIPPNLPPGLPPIQPFPTQEESNGIAVDFNGDAYIVGSTSSADFPTTTNALRSTGGLAPTAFVVRVNSTGSKLVYSSYIIGGGGVDIIERGTAIAVSEPGIAVIGGYTNSSELEGYTSKGAFQEKKAGNPLSPDGFIVKLDTNAATGPASNLYITYLGGGVGVNDGVENIQGLAVDPAGNIYVVGDTRSTDFPTTPNAYDRTFNGGEYDVFFTKISPAKNGAADLLYSTYLGGSGYDSAGGVALDRWGNVYVAGDTDSSNFPTLKAYDGSYNGNEDAFLTKFTTSRSGADSLLYSTYLGGVGVDAAFGVAADCLGRAHIVGVTSIFPPDIPSTNFPTTADAYDASFNGVQDVTVSIINTLDTGAKSLVYSTFIGGGEEDAGFGIALDQNTGDFYIVGLTGSQAGSQFPTTKGAYQAAIKGESDAFIVKFQGEGDRPCDIRVASDQRAGSVLFYNLITSSTTMSNAENTRISITNISQKEPALVHLFFVDGGNCSVADSFLCLTPNQTAVMVASDIDPGTTGYVVAIACDPNGFPTQFNYLIGDEYVKLATGHAANLAAEAFAAGDKCGSCKGPVTATLRFDGLEYSMASRVVAVSSIPSPSDASTLLVLNRFGGNLLTNAATIGSVFGLLFDDTENSFSFGFTGSCQSKNLFSASFPRTAPRLPQVIPPGRTGWMKLWGAGDVALLGAVIYNGSAKGYNQGHNLHRLTLTRSATLEIPIFPPSC